MGHTTLQHVTFIHPELTSELIHTILAADKISKVTNFIIRNFSFSTIKHYKAHTVHSMIFVKYYSNTWAE